MNRRDVDDPAAAAPFDHLPGGELRTEEGALQVNVEHFVREKAGSPYQAGSAIGR